MAKKATKSKLAKQVSASAPPRKPPQQTAPWGRSALDYRPGLFIRDYLREHGEGCASDIYKALSEKIIGINEQRAKDGDRPIRRPNYHSFGTYFYWFLLLDIIKRTGREEPANREFLHPRVFYSLTAKGKSEVAAWGDPIAAAHPEYAHRTPAFRGKRS